MSDVIDVDAEGLRCPLPVLRLGKALRAAPTGSLVRLRADDAMAQVDVPHFCHESGHRLSDIREEQGVFVFTVEKR